MRNRLANGLGGRGHWLDMLGRGGWKVNDSVHPSRFDPHSGSKVWEAPDREIGKPGENRGKVIAHRDLQPTAAFNDRCRTGVLVRRSPSTSGKPF